MDKFEFEIVERGTTGYFKTEAIPHMFFFKPKKKEGLIECKHKWELIKTEDGFMMASEKECPPISIIMFGETQEEVKKKFEEAFVMSLFVAGMLEIPTVREKLKEEHEYKLKQKQQGHEQDNTD